MQFTNEQGLPEPIVRAVTNDPYQRGQRTDFSVTQLLGPPRIRVLRKRHSDEIVEDVADRIYALLGQSIHTILERANVVGLAELRLYAELDGLTISGQFDRCVSCRTDSCRTTSSARSGPTTTNRNGNNSSIFWPGCCAETDTK